ncbi:PucR family transcriptional regulator ligand-binding domain-containing protein [Salicibibacter cibarius]|uniref:PucR family transcriptional regulator ligand-binding domain-containing protein n=1 Tax=Salicibibacter cibarius TaxID=2743000 RepID=A0A7T7CCQ5_9BACI|nr:PucR family transcriptional regulator [Salicibibacter cibarius]QQK77234.1 PucR family transcriptional regulator ligand-binding domain-containing protein [Salicibibacter cibarius]
MKSVNDLFLIESLKNSTVMAGHRGLTRGVQTVNISDTPDAIDHLNEHELLLTTGYAFKGEPEALCRLIEKMNDRNCSGIIVKLERYLYTLPEKAKIVADSLSLPVIHLPLEYKLGELSQKILNLLNDARAEQLYYAMDLHQKFSDMMIQGYTLQSLIKQVSYYIKRPLMLTNHRGEIKCLSQPYASSEEVRLDKRKQTTITNTIKQDLLLARKGGTFFIEENNIGSITTFPIQTKRLQPNMLVILDAVTLAYPLSETAIEQAANVISFTILKEEAIEENLQIIKNNFFTDLIEKRIDTDSEIESRCAYYGLRQDAYYLMILSEANGENIANWSLRKEKEIAEIHQLIFENMEDALLSHAFNGVLFSQESYVATVLQFDTFNDDVLANVKTFLQHIQTNVFEQGINLSFGISNYVQNLQALPNAYHEASEALQSGYINETGPFIHIYKVRELMELLQMIPVKNLYEFYRHTLKALAKADTKEVNELTKTTRVYLDTQCEISETSRKLFVHRNTVKYRIEKIESMLGCSLRDPSDSLRIRTALLVGGLLDHHNNAIRE